MIKEILQDNILMDWEETSREYCKLMIIKSKGGSKGILLCDD